MYRFFLTFVFVAFFLLSPGCKQAPFKGDGKDKSGTAIHAKESNRKAYRTLAKFLSDSWDTKRQKPPNAPDLAQILAEGHNAVLDMNALTVDDPDLLKVREEGKAATEEAIVAFRNLGKLPPPAGAGELILTGFLCGVARRFDLAAAADLRAQNDANAIVAEVRKLNSAYQRACSAKLLLKRAAANYAGAANLGEVSVEIDESFILNPEDWITLTNRTGKQLNNVLIAVLLTGQAGETKENVHFVPSWKVGEQLFAAYSGGITVAEMNIGRQTVVQIQSAKISVLADEGRTEFTYEFAGLEKSRNVAREFNVIRSNVRWAVRDGVFGGKVFVLVNKTGITLPAVSVSTSAGTRSYGAFSPGDSFEVGGLQIERNLKDGDLVRVLIAGRELNAITIGVPRNSGILNRAK